MHTDLSRDAALTESYDEGYEHGFSGRRTPRVDAVEAAIAFWRLHNASFHAYWQGMRDGVTARGEQ